MSPKVTGWDELHLAENPAVELLQSLGYTYVTPEALEPERTNFKEPILTNRLAAALMRLNPWLSDTNVTRAVKAVQVPAATLAEANETLYTSLTYGIALEQDRGDGRKSHTVRFLDFDKPNRNEWIVTRQYKVLGSKKHVIPDIVVFVNGLPLAVIECKSPTIGDTWKAEAVKQLHRYQEAGTRWKDQGAPKLFEAAQILVATCGERAVYGTVGTPERFFLGWKEPYPLAVKQLGEKLGRTPTPQDILLYGLFEPRNPARHRAELCRVRGRRRPHHPQADPLQAVHRRERGDASHPHCPEAERAGRNRLAHPRVGEEPDHALARAQAPPRRVAAATHRGHRHRPHQARPADCRGVHRVRLSEPRARGQRARPPAHPRAPHRQDGDDHDPEVPGDRRRRRRRAAWVGPPHAVRGCQHLRDGGRGPPHAVPEPRRQHAPGAAQRLLPRLYRHPHRQEGPEHAAHLRPLHRHLHHRAGGAGRSDGAHLLREPAPGTPHHRTDHRPGLRPRLRRPHRGRTRGHQAALRHRASNRRRPAPHRGDLPGPHRPLHAVHRPQRIQGPGGCDEPPRRGHPTRRRWTG